MSPSEAGYRFSEAASNPEAQGLIKNQLIQKVDVKGREGRDDEVRAKVAAVFFLWCFWCFKLRNRKEKKVCEVAEFAIFQKKKKPTCRCSRLVTITLAQKRKLPKHSWDVTLNFLRKWWLDESLSPGTKPSQFQAWLCVWDLEYTLSPFVLHLF